MNFFSKFSFKEWRVKLRYASLWIQATLAALTSGWLLVSDDIKSTIYDAVSDFTGGSIKPSYIILAGAISTILAQFYRQRSVLNAQLREEARKQIEAEEAAEESTKGSVVNQNVLGEIKGVDDDHTRL